MERLKGKVALISGAAKGMGAVEARMFAKQGASKEKGDVIEDDGAKLAMGIGRNKGHERLWKARCTCK